MMRREWSSSRPMAPRYHAHAPAVPLPLALPLLSLGPGCASCFGQTFRPNICSKRLLDWHFMTTSGTAAACGAAARPRAMCPLARRAPSAASPQRFSSSLSFSLALSLHITCPLFSPCSNAGSPCLPTHPVASGDGLGSTTPHEPRAGESARRACAWVVLAPHRHRGPRYNHLL